MSVCRVCVGVCMWVCVRALRLVTHLRRLIIKESVFHVCGRHSLHEGFDGEDHSVHELELFILRQAARFGPRPLLVIDARTGPIEYINCVYRHCFLRPLSSP